VTFIVTPEPFSTTGPRGRFETIEGWAREGHDALPRQIREIEYSLDNKLRF